MKKSIIFLKVLISFFAFPVFVSTPKPENAPAPTSEDTMFLGLEQLTIEELLEIIGKIAPNNTMLMDGRYSTRDGMLYSEILKDALIHLAGMTPITIGDLIKAFQTIVNIIDTIKDFPSELVKFMLDYIQKKYGNIPIL